MFSMKIVDPKTSGKDWIDFTSLSTYQKCPRKYFWRSIMNLVESKEAVALINGKAYHEAIATYHTKIKAGETFENAVVHALADARDIMRDITVDDPKRNISVAIDTLTGYFLKYREEPYETIMVETAGALDLGEFLFIFRVDRLVKIPYGIITGYAAMETKTTTVVGTKWQKRGKPNLQIEGYMFGMSALTGENILNGVLDVIPIHENPVRREAPFRILTTRTEDEMAVWHHNIMEWWKSIKQCKTDNFFPMTTDNCFPMFGAECEYTLLCQKYPNPHILGCDIAIPEEYKISEWKPYEF